MAKGFRPVDRDQQFLLPPDMGRWLPEDHLVWLIISIVAELDLTVLVARHRLGGVGRRAYDPRMMLALLIYAYADGVHSSRQIERLCHTDVAFRVLCAQDAPDHSVIARFRKTHIDAFTSLFTQVLVLCARSGMVRVGQVAVDGTKIAADASLAASHGRDWFARKAAEDAVTEAERVDAAEDSLLGESRGDEVPAELADPASRRARIRRCLAELDAEHASRETGTERQRAAAAEYVRRARTEPPRGRPPAGVDPVELAEARVERLTRTHGPDHRFTRAAREKAGQEKAGRDAETTDTARSTGKSKSESTSRRNATDPDSRIMPTRNGWIQGYNAQFDVTADHMILAVGLCQDTGDMAQCEPMMRAAEQAVEHLNRTRLAGQAKHRIDLLLYDNGYCSEDNLTLAGPDRLIATGTTHTVTQQAKDHLADGPPPQDASPTEQMRHRLRTPDGITNYTRRGATVEPVIGHIKDRVGLRQFSLRGITHCLGELNLAALTHNLRRLHTIWTPHTTAIHQPHTA